MAFEEGSRLERLPRAYVRTLRTPGPSCFIVMVFAEHPRWMWHFAKGCGQD